MSIDRNLKKIEEKIVIVSLLDKLLHEQYFHILRKINFKYFHEE